MHCILLLRSLPFYVSNDTPACIHSKCKAGLKPKLFPKTLFYTYICLCFSGQLFISSHKSFNCGFEICYSTYLLCTKIETHNHIIYVSIYKKCHVVRVGGLLLVCSSNKNICKVPLDPNNHMHTLVRHAVLSFFSGAQ